MENEEAKYLAEFICRRIAGRQKINLVDKFWRSSSYWEKQYKQHIIAAYSLLKLYSYQVILNSLNRKEGWWITSLRCKQLHDLCRDEQEKLKLIEEQPKIDIKIETTHTAPGAGLSKKNKLDRLRDE